jgi:dipeptidase E
MITSPRIVAIGGGELKNLETLKIDRCIVELAEKRKPKALFLPTASGDADAYVEVFDKVYGKRLGCKTNSLRLIHNPPSYEEMSALILNSDLIYVGGGNTYRMMKIWRLRRVDGLLKKAAYQGIVLCGISAGATCWFKFGHSDSPSFSGRQEWDYIRVRGLSLISALYCPHYHIEKRELSLSQMVTKYGGVALACDNNAAIEVVGDHYRVLVSSRSARAYKIFKCRGKILTRQLSADKEYKPLSDLLRRNVARFAARRG